ELTYAVGKTLRLPPREGAPEHTDDGASLEERKVQRDLRDVAGREPEHEKAAAPRGRSQRRFGEPSTHRIEDDVSALVVGGAFDLIPETVIDVVDRRIGAV